MQRQMFFGTADRMTWIPAPLASPQITSTFWRDSANYLNGGAYIRHSATSHKVFSYSWGTSSMEDLAELQAYFDGAYGDPPFYFLDPLAARSNCLPLWIAAPALGLEDAPVLAEGLTPTSTGLVPNTNHYPFRGATYSLNVGTDHPVYVASIPVPAGYTLWVGVHGAATGDAHVNVGSTPCSLLDTSDAQRTDTAVDGDGGLIDLTLSGNGYLTIYGMIAQVLPVGESPSIGGFVPGRGHSGVRLSNDPQVTEYSAAIPGAQVAMTAEFTETGAWETKAKVSYSVTQTRVNEATNPSFESVS